MRANLGALPAMPAWLSYRTARCPPASV